MSGRSLILITRPADDAADYAAELAGLGFKTLAAPMLTIEPCDFDVPDLEPYQGLVFTSANAVRVFAAATEKGRDITAYVVGQRTGEAAKAAGFKLVHSADGVSGDVVDLIRAQVFDTERRFLHVRGEHVARPLHVLLAVAGYKADILIVYNALPAADFDVETLAALKAGDIFAITFFSKRTGERFIELVEQHRLQGCLRAIKALCISDAVLDCLRSQPWAETYAAPTPDRPGMLQLLKKIAP